MILADTSVWVDHLRARDARMTKLLRQRRVLLHPMVIAELALGSLPNRSELLFTLDALPQAQVAHLIEVRRLIEARSLYARGIGLTDVCLLASVLISPPTFLWTNDKRLRAVAEAFGVHQDTFD